MDCPFCNINPEKTRVIKSTTFFLIVFSNPRLMPGHLLVIPKRHVEKISELKEEEQKDLFNILCEFQEKILKNIAQGCDIRQNYRPFINESKYKINHLHFHLQPRKLYDELYNKCQINEKDVFKELNSNEFEKVKELFSD